ncbi:putative gustatory receptor 58a [Bactrocera neohumeralis]|uniref:putative gustatory receptor 58a n=1 Tax=Bactrocera neohumeralis TaxID=98809 RepID=UPI00216670CA|nr:putative gustatory receptor 58a [Bactrocera neohumeralis]
MLRERLFRFVLKISYYNSLIVGLLPAPLDGKTLEFRVTRLYLVHSAVIHLFCLLATSYAGYYYFSRDFLTNDPILQWTYSITHVTKNLFMAVLVKEIWCKREDIKSVYVVYRSLETRLKAFTEAARRRINGTIEKRNELHRTIIEHRVENLIIFKFCLAYVLVIMNVYSFLSQHPGTDGRYMPITLISFALHTFILTVSGNFFYIYSQLYRQFSQINSQLKSLFEQLHGQMSRRAVGEEFASHINNLAVLHLTGYRLTQRIFRIGELTLAALLLRLFTTNMRAVYGACLLLSQNQTRNLWLQANELFFTAVFFGDTAMTMGMLDAMLTKCNRTGQLLREHPGLVDICESNSLRKALDTFASQLSCHKLRYMLCGLFEFNKEATLQFFLMVLVKTSVLVQFDMQNKLRINKK